MHPNPGSYDDCAERALVNRLLEVFNCSVISSKETVLKLSSSENIQVPFISAGQDLPTCEVNETAQEVSIKSLFCNIPSHLSQIDLGQTCNLFSKLFIISVLNLCSIDRWLTQSMES